MAKVVKQITLRHPSANLTRRLKQLSEKSGKSLNATVLALLEKAVGLDDRRERLARYVTWSKEDLSEFVDALGAQRSVDSADWR